jgi:hypothetical protein
VAARAVGPAGLGAPAYLTAPAEGGGVPLSAATTPRPLPPAVIRRLPRLTVVVAVPRRLRAEARAIVTVRVSRPLRGALMRVQLRRGLRDATIAQGRVSGRRVPVALSFRAPGRYLVRIQTLEPGRRARAVVRPVTVRR